MAQFFLVKGETILFSNISPSIDIQYKQDTWLKDQVYKNWIYKRAKFPNGEWDVFEDIIALGVTLYARPIDGSVCIEAVITKQDVEDTTFKVIAASSIYINEQTDIPETIFDIFSKQPLNGSWPCTWNLLKSLKIDLVWNIFVEELNKQSETKEDN